MLMICDAERPVAVGGVMGGADTEVRPETTTVLLESAYFNPASVRRTSRALGLSTDAAYRFERGRDIEGVIPALDRAAQLMADLGGGTVSRGVIDVYPAPRPHTRIALRLERVERVIGAAPERRRSCASSRRSASRWTTRRPCSRWWCRASAGTSSRRTTSSRRSCGSGATTRSR